MKTLLFLLLLLLPVTVDFDAAVLRITGAGSMEELDETTLERFRSLALHPVSLNSAGRSRLVSCGLFSAFQAASLIDYRTRTGDILSFTELSLVDGFPADFVEALRPFVRLDSSGPPGKRHSERLHADAMMRGAVRASDDTVFAAGGKVKLSLGDRAELNWGTRTTYTDGTLRLGTVSAAVYGRKYLGKLILGHFNARFGQGLAQWSGFSLQPYGSVASLRRSGTGFSATGSFSPELCGIATDWDLGRWNVGIAYSFKGKLPIVAASYVGQRFTAGVTATSKAVSLDWRIGIPDASVYGELAWNGTFQGLAGVMWVPSYGSKVSVVGRYIDGIPELIAGASAWSAETVVAVSSGQFRSMVKYAPPLSLGPLVFTPSLRLAARSSGTWRFEGRGEAGLAWNGWSLHSRLDIVHCEETSWLINAEAGRTEGALKAYLRWTLFRVDKWPDRIYVYERDAPGSFNVPAYYGKGWSLSLAGSWRPSRRHAFYLRLSYIGYPWMDSPKPSRTEIKVQYQLSL